MLRILAVDDHAIVRNGLKILFEGSPGAVTFGEAGGAQDALRLIREQEWDVVVMDITLGDRSGLEVMKEMKLLCPKLPFLILSMHSEAQYARRAFKAGASGYITKDSLPDELARAIRKVAQGGKYVSETLAELLITDVDGGCESAPHDKLSGREFEIMCLIASGKTVGEIADLLSRSVKTISTYRARILEKMGMRTNAEITYYVIQNKLLE
ncbi:MAG: response regulator transcription factor [Acidobacteriota bacterium]|nr:response regulator transcription factor [Acidobacteriota bacterium]MDQ5835630.1 response regulator transcription factor [Acidobacteriota bacterium]